MEQRNLSQALSTLRIKDQFDFDSFTADGFRVQDIIDKTCSASTTTIKQDRGAAALEPSHSWDQINNVLTSFQR